MLTALRAARPTHSLLRLAPFLAAPTHAPRPGFSRLAPPLCRKLPRFRSRAFTSASVRCMSAGTKRMAPKTIGTHDGSFHCDEALGCFLLHQTKAYADATIVRSRDPEVLSGCDVVIDVGATYEPEKNRFDHHPRGFEEVFGHGFVTKFPARLGASTSAARSSPTCSASTRRTKRWRRFPRCPRRRPAADAVDNGVNMYDTDAPAKYENNTKPSARVGKLNLPGRAHSAEIYMSASTKPSR